MKSVIKSIIAVLMSGIATTTVESGICMSTQVIVIQEQRPNVAGQKKQHAQKNISASEYSRSASAHSKVSRSGLANNTFAQVDFDAPLPAPQVFKKLRLRSRSEADATRCAQLIADDSLMRGGVVQNPQFQDTAVPTMLIGPLPNQYNNEQKDQS